MITFIFLLCKAGSTLIAEDLPTTQPTPEFDFARFHYNRPTKLVAEETTPTGQQLHWTEKRPPPDRTPLDTQLPQPVAANLGPMKVIRLRFIDACNEVVPVLLATSATRKPPFPLVLALHAIYCDKSQMLSLVGPPLVHRGFAVLALDLPCHGERDGEILSLFDPRDPAKAKSIQRTSVIDVRQCIDLAEERPNELDVHHGVYVMGYSMGSWVGCYAAGCDARIAGMALCMAGAAPPKATALAEQFAAFDTAAAIFHFHGPLLMLNGDHDALIPKDWTVRLFNAAHAPKAQRWYDASHALPPAAIDEAAVYLAGLRDKMPLPSDESPPLRSEAK